MMLVVSSTSSFAKARLPLELVPTAKKSRAMASQEWRPFSLSATLKTNFKGAPQPITKVSKLCRCAYYECSSSRRSGPDEEALLSNVEVNVALVLMRHIGAEVAT